jgi:uncharacterized protein (DUF1778 family)
MARTGRPPKEKRLLMTAPLRIMLTADQKDLIERAAQTKQLEVAAWARPILLQAAQEVISKAEMLGTRRTKQK